MALNSNEILNNNLFKNKNTKQNVLLFDQQKLTKNKGTLNTKLQINKKRLTQGNTDTTEDTTCNSYFNNFAFHIPPIIS